MAATTAAAGLCIGLTGTPALAEPAARPLSGPLASPLAEPIASPEPWIGDSVRAEQWHLKTLNVAGAWTYANGAGVTVAVIDSGVDADHVDLQGQVLPGLDLVDPDGDGDTDLVGHGTTVSAIIAGRDDDAGVIGIAPKAKILPIRVLDRENRYDDALIVAKGVRWAVDHGARVINLSLGGNGSSPALAAALDYAFAKDVVVVACTGNASASTSSSTGVWYPAREPGVIAVAGMEKDGDVLWSGSITGKETVVDAPATQLVGARPDGYWRVQGTSFAAPMVSGTAALVRSRWPTMSAAEVVNRIVRTAKDRGPKGHDAEYGYGMVDPTAALTADVPAVQRNPLDTTASPGVAGFGNAPASGQAQSAPDTAASVGARAPGSNAGTAARAGEAGVMAAGRGWWAAGVLFLVSVLAALLTFRRFASVA
ncbi:type VII secretion-associated serine protease mycosin [Actinoplanes sp. NPDC026623]|uniref:type VII secretion-associated serine protease mycosin n=1 Tax=Actinoplanes sp. NPDC026623 TaxID=3155610 RepID=UPI00340CE362